MTKLQNKVRKGLIGIEDVKRAEFGCKNCLWCSCECTGGTKFEAATTKDGKHLTCAAYTYYD
jgi:hypothetical protein